MLCHVESQGLCKQQQRLRCQSQCHRLSCNDTSSTPVGFHCYGLPWRDALKQPRQTSFRTASMEQHHENCEHSLLQIKTDRLKVGSTLNSKPNCLINNMFFSWPQRGIVECPKIQVRFSTEMIVICLLWLQLMFLFIIDCVPLLILKVFLRTNPLLCFTLWGKHGGHSLFVRFFLAEY